MSKIFRTKSLLNKKILYALAAVSILVFAFVMFKADSHEVNEELNPTQQYSSWHF